MIFVIGPLVQGASNRRTRFVKVGAYISAMVLSASVLGASVSIIGHSILRQVPITWLALAVGILLYGARELGLLRLPLPQSSWQVPRVWMRLGPFVYPLLYGLAIGIGVLTRAPFASFQTMVAWQLAMGSVGVGAAMGAAYAIARGSAPLLLGLTASDPSLGLLRGTRWIAERQGLWRLANGVFLGLLGGVLTSIALA
jgi:cytochrome c biogenesis protein CcdA